MSGVPFALLYGAVARLLFGQNLMGDAFATLSLAFLVVAPLGVGALAVWFTRGWARTSWGNAILAPWIAIGLGAVVAALFFVEAWICVVMALPILMVMSALGGLLMCAILRRRAARGQMSVLSVLLLAPFLTAPIEHQFVMRTATVTVETQVVIEADAATVWNNLIRVAPIQEQERTASPVFDLFGAPRPLMATLDQARVGGIRRGLFEDHLTFIETIKMWEPERRIEWSIVTDTTQVTRAPWPEIGGRYFTVTGAAYQIERLEPERVLLTLSSTHRLTTRFNQYGLLWTRWGLAEFQRQILHILKQRAEQEAAS